MAAMGMCYSELPKREPVAYGLQLQIHQFHAEVILFSAFQSMTEQNRSTRARPFLSNEERWSGFAVWFPISMAEALWSSTAI